jgi:hypothetical protein
MNLSFAAPSKAPRHDVAFELPIPGLFVDLDAGSASVCLTDEFLQAPAGIKLEVLQQWIADLLNQREAALVELFRAFAADLPTLTIVEQIEHFRLHCVKKAIPCPPDIAILLQRY